MKNSVKYLKNLLKFLKIEELIERAETQEQKVEILKDEYAKLEAIIQSESERLSLITRKEQIEKNAKSLLEELNVIESELQAFEGTVKGVSVEEVNKLRERIQANERGDVVFRLGGSQFVIEREQIMHTPFFGF